MGQLAILVSAPVVRILQRSLREPAFVRAFFSMDPAMETSPTMKGSRFQGFSEDTIRFLRELARHNTRSWFEANRERYETEVREPALQYIEAMAEPLAKISPHFRAVPKKVGGSLMRVHRDLRFSRDKRPYKTNIGIQFRHEAGKDVHAPGYYLHIDPQEVFLGVGIWHPDSHTLRSIRDAIDQEPTAWKRAVKNKAFRNQFDLAGDRLKRPPQGYSADHPLIDDLKWKDFIGVCSLDHEDILLPSLVQETTQAFRAAKSYMAFLCRAIGVKF